MKITVVATAVAVALGAAAFAADPHDHAGHGKQQAPTTAPASTQPTTKAAAGKAVNQYCAVMSDEKIDPKVTTVYRGKTIGFCCADCIDEFKKDPEKYMKTLK